jgi:hypothetical protein
LDEYGQPSGLTPLLGRRSYAVSIGIIFTIAFCALLSLHIGEGGTSAHFKRMHDTKGVQEKFPIVALIKKLWGNQDPFAFQCPLPISLSVTSMGGFMQDVNVPAHGPSANVTASNGPLQVIEEGLAAVGESQSSAPEVCCNLYSKSWWPYQFPECRNDGNCPSCWAISGESAFSDPIAGVAGVAWASSVAAFSEEYRKKSLLPKPIRKITSTGPLLATMNTGLHEHLTNVCPKVSHWHQYTFEFKLDQLRVRAYKSEAEKLAVIAFRGTEPQDVINWMVDVNIATEPLQLKSRSRSKKSATNTTAHVHRGFLDALRHLMPKVKKWVDGYIFGWGKVPKDWTLIFTGHSMGAAFAVLASTLAFSEDWDRKPDAVIPFGGPRVADESLSLWWEKEGLCDKLLRINVYNDLVKHVPFAQQAINPLAFKSCARNIKECFNMHPSPKDPMFDDWWRHVCPSRELLIPGAMKGVNGKLEDFNLLGGTFAHLTNQCRYGYVYGMLHSPLMKKDKHCGISPDICPPTFSCKVVEDLAGKQCAGLQQNKAANSSAECRESCCTADAGSCEVWQWLKPGHCWTGRSNSCTKVSLWAKKCRGK